MDVWWRDDGRNKRLSLVELSVAVNKKVRVGTDQMKNSTIIIVGFDQREIGGGECVKQSRWTDRQTGTDTQTDRHTYKQTDISIQ